MIKELLLQKGWAGKTISRQETVERLNPLIREFIRLNHWYDAVERSTSDPDTQYGIKDFQKTARADVSKLAETVFSCGGTAYNGTDLEASDFDLGSDNASMVSRLVELEQNFLKSLEAESEVEHQMRTRAILSVVAGNAQKRLDFLRERSRHLMRDRRG